MRGRNPLILIIMAIFFGMACTFSTKLPTPTPPADAEEPALEVTRPQTTFIDARTIADAVPADAESAGVAEAESAALAESGGGSAGASSYGSGGYGGGYGGGYYGGWSGYYGWGCTPRYDWAYSYVVQYGDTLNNIAWRAGTSWPVLAQGNCIYNPNYIYAGQYLRLPSPISYYPPPHYPPHYPPPYHPPYPPHPTYGPPYPTPVPATPAPPPPVVVGSALTFAPYVEINNSTVILSPDTMITISWVGTFPTATDRVTFELIAPGDSMGTPIGIDTNLGDGATITWFATAYIQGTVRAVASFTGGYPPQYSDSYYIIAGFPP